MSRPLRPSLSPEQASIGMLVQVSFEEFEDGLVLHQFAPVTA